jgi:hypothetical protein
VVCVNTTTKNGLFGIHQALDHFERVPPVLGGRAARTVVALTRAGDSMFIWGWEQGLFNETALIPSGASSACAMQPGIPLAFWHSANCVTEFQQARPPLFVDATGPGREGLDRARAGYETLPFLADYLARDYRMVSDEEGYRIFLRRDRLAGAQ